LWFDYSKFNLKNFNISLTSYYEGRYLNLHKDKSSELTTVIVLSDDFDADGKMYQILNISDKAVMSDEALIQALQKLMSPA
jgi:hypothetical protein